MSKRVNWYFTATFLVRYGAITDIKTVTGTAEKDCIYEAAVEAVEETYPDAVIVDMMTLEVDGYAVADRECVAEAVAA